MSQLPLHFDVLGPEGDSGRETFVLVHGYGASGFSWRHWTPRLAQLGRVVVVDLKGFGSAPKPDDGRYAPSDQAALVTSLIERLDLSNVTLVGHSLGGGVALLVALTASTASRPWLRRLVSVAGAAYPQRLPPFVRMAEWPRLTSALFRLVGAQRVARSALHMIVAEPGSITKEQVLGYAEPLASPEALRVLLTSARQIVPPDLDTLVRDYPRITTPTLLLWGREDPVVPLEVGRRLARDLPRARLEVIEDCGHLVAEERPMESLAVLERFLRES